MARLHAFGSNGNGQLGIGSDEDTSAPQLVHFHPPLPSHDATSTTTVPRLPPFHDFAAGGNHTALITLNDQRLYMTGSNKDNESLLPKPVQVFTQHTISSVDATKPQQQRWRSIACGWAFTIAVAELDDAVSSATVGTRSAARSKVFAWGSGAFGELGLGPGLTKTGPKALEIQTGLLSPSLQHSSTAGATSFEILKVRAGLRHVLLLARENERLDNQDPLENGTGRRKRTRTTVLMGWGSNRQGQLGALERTPSGEHDKTPLLPPLPFADKELRGKFMEPTRVLIPRNHVETEAEPEIVDMACGQSHSLVLFSDGAVYSSGFNKYGQLGPCIATNSSSISSLTSLPSLSSAASATASSKQQDFRIGFEKVQCLPFVDSISCGWNHNAAMDTRPLAQGGSSIIYLWGRNDHGQLGGGMPYKLVLVDLHGTRTVDSGIVQLWIPKRLGATARGINLDDSTAPENDQQDERQEIVSYSCGSEHTLAMTSSGDCYAWGWNEHGNCGSGSENSVQDLQDVPSPRKVQFCNTASTLTTPATTMGHRWVMGGYGSSWVWT
ncbi:hypothetical protein EDD11_004981 [Mortierella claussenii]|nr:hypothetical protein EDD11_004981 [Mortierella claussenii]